MWSLLKIELFKVFKRPRTYIAFIAVLAIVVLIQVAIYADGAKYMDFVLKDVKDNFDVIGNPLNGYFVCFVILQTLLIHVPLLVALVSADMIAGEANMGTLRLLITKPVSRTKLLLSKFFASAIYAVILLIWIAILGLFVSMLIFGTDGLMNAKSYEIIILNGDDIFWRYLLAFGFAAIALITVSAVGFFFSIFAENSLGPIVATMSVIIVFTILTTLDIPLFQSVKDFFFTSHMIAWKGFFEMKLNADGESIPGTIRNLPAVLRSAGVLLLHIVLLVGASIFIFKRKDVLS
ncbi:ABC transporter permease [Lacibacter sp. H407]|uniref:ABC transporter permease n=1 Tax=Lacibacter sp. H407 TaxID=3133423 RepID=UPI0030BEEBAB